MSEIADAGGLFFDLRRERRIQELREELSAAKLKSEQRRIWRELRAAIYARSSAQVARMEMQKGIGRQRAS